MHLRAGGGDKAGPAGMGGLVALCALRRVRRAASVGGQQLRRLTWHRPVPASFAC